MNELWVGEKKNEEGCRDTKAAWVPPLSGGWLMNGMMTRAIMFQSLFSRTA